MSNIPVSNNIEQFPILCCDFCIRLQYNFCSTVLSAFFSFLVHLFVSSIPLKCLHLDKKPSAAGAEERVLEKHVRGKQERKRLRSNQQNAKNNEKWIWMAGLDTTNKAINCINITIWKSFLHCRLHAIKYTRISHNAKWDTWQARARKMAYHILKD